MPKYDESSNPADIQVGDDPNHKMLMAWRVTDDVGEHVVQYHHGSIGFGTSPHNFSMHEGDTFVGTMGLDHDGRIQHIETHPEKRRLGLATKMYKLAQEVHGDIPSIPAPQHSQSRTDSGDAWAKKVGGEVPVRRTHVMDTEYTHARWPSLRSTDISGVKAHLNEFHAKMLENGLDRKNLSEARFHVDSAHEYLSQAEKVGKDHSSYSDHVGKAHEHIHELGYIHEDSYGSMADHDSLQEHISKLY